MRFHSLHAFHPHRSPRVRMINVSRPTPGRDAFVDQDQNQPHIGLLG
ncbi:hypothetical protein FB566_2679 [Stackebrandtia endophytica]|uniref:Uncharacterized protein n=1 Tax=Stackebrandtia endophytica TaxID=1496996 RepID=A0A543AX41_9ACTN|nr:hypothetical protein FB566_2679 [Stackebrandtia endophytica]